MYKCLHCQTEYDVRPAGDNCSHCGAPMAIATKTDVVSSSRPAQLPQVGALSAPTSRATEPAQPVNPAQKNATFWDTTFGCLSILAVPLGGILVLFIDYTVGIYGSPVYSYLSDWVWSWSVWQPWMWPVPWDFFEPLVGVLLYLIVGIPMVLPVLIWFLIGLVGLCMVAFPITYLSKNTTN